MDKRAAISDLRGIRSDQALGRAEKDEDPRVEKVRFAFTFAAAADNLPSPQVLGGLKERERPSDNRSGSNIGTEDSR